jgi:hypothetical protein
MGLHGLLQGWLYFYLFRAPPRTLSLETSNIIYSHIISQRLTRFAKPWPKALGTLSRMHSGPCDVHGLGYGLRGVCGL